MKIYATKKEDFDIIKEKLIDFVDKSDKSWRYVTPQELEKSDMTKYFLLDIRDKEAFGEGHIKGSKNIFWKDLLKDENLKRLPKDKTILLICYVGHTASQMLVALSLLGYKAKVLKFGMGKSPVRGVPVAGWESLGFETVS